MPTDEGKPVNKEAVYDERVFPLMKQVIETCKEHGIACFATFDISTEDNPDFYCTTCLPDETGEAAGLVGDCLALLDRRPDFVTFTITKAGG